MKIMKMNYHIKAWIIGLFVIITTLPAQSALCTYRQVVGSGDIDAANVNSPDPLDANITILMANPIGTIQCCGIIIAWEMYMEGPGWVIVQVWRRVVEENKYMLLGQNAVRHKSNGISKEGRSISNKNAIHVKPGDTIGFVQKDVSILRYTTCDPVSPTDPSVCADDQLVNTNALEASIGDAVEFVTKQSTHVGISDVRGYALKAYMNKKSSVSCTDKHKTISDTLDVGEHVINLHVENMDVHDPDSSIKFVSNDQSLPVAIDSNTGEITVSGELSPDYPSTLYELTVEVYDSCSDSSSTCAINITVNNDPKPIIFNSLPSSIELSALETGHVYDFTISRQRDVDNVDCYVHSTFPDHATFDIRNRSKTDYSVYLTRTPLISDILQWSTYTVVLVISCESTEGQYNQTTLSLIFDSDKRRLGTLMVVVGVMLTLIILAALTVLMTWLCQKGKVKIWPGDDKDRDNAINKSHNTTSKQPEKDVHSGETDLWDNFNSYYKVDRGITSMESPIYVGFQNGGLANHFSKANRSILISHSQQRNFEQEMDNFYPPEEKTYPKQLFRKKPWKP